MSADTTIKKRTKSKKAPGEEAVVLADSISPVEASAKKTRARKAVSKAVENAGPDEGSLEPPTTKKSREVKKKETPKTMSKSPTSKRAAKTSGNELQIEHSSENASQILTQATAFTAEKEKPKESTAGSAGQQQILESELKEPRDLDSKGPLVMKSNAFPKHTTNKTTSNKSPSKIESTKAASQLPSKPSSFLSSFFNDPEPAPVPPPQEQQDRIESPEESRAGLKQTRKHDFEDSILTSRGKVKESSPPQSSSQPPSQSTPTMVDPSGSAMPSAQLRAFTTSSFKSLKANSKDNHGKPKPPLNVAESPAIAEALKSSNTALRNHAEALVELDAQIKKESAASAPQAGLSSETISIASSSPNSKSPPTTRPSNPTVPPSTTKPEPKSTPSISAKPPPKVYSSAPKSLPPDALPQRPTSLTYQQLQKNPHYRSLRRRWTAVMVAIPFLVGSSWELWRRWDRRDFGRHVDGMSAGMEQMAGQRGSVREDGGGGVGVSAGVSGRVVESGLGKWEHAPAVQEASGMEAVATGQTGRGAARDIAAEKQDAPVLGRLPGIEIESGPDGPAEVPNLQQQGGSKRGWVQVFK